MQGEEVECGVEGVFVRVCRRVRVCGGWCGGVGGSGEMRGGVGEWGGVWGCVRGCGGV